MDPTGEVGPENARVVKRNGRHICASERAHHAAARCLAQPRALVCELKLRIRFCFVWSARRKRLALI